MERSAVEMLLEYPRGKGIPFETHENENTLHLSPSDPNLKSRYVHFREGAITFLAYDSYALKAGSSNTFSGIYTELTPDNTAEFSIYKKDWTHLFLLNNKKKAGDKQIDTHLTIVSKKNLPLYQWINSEIVNQFLDLAEKVTPIKILAKMDYLPIIPDLRGKNVIGIETNQWLYKKEDLNQLIENGSKILATVNKSITY